MSLLKGLRPALGLLRRLPMASRGPAVSRLLERTSTRLRRLDAVIAGHPETVVFICHGNIMRSAFALAYARANHIGMARRLTGAGTHAAPGRPAQQSAMLVAEEMGYSLAAHRARPLSGIDPGRNALLLCMDRANEANVMAHWPRLSDRVFLIGDATAADGPSRGDAERMVRDPYGLGDGATRIAFRRIAELIDLWAIVLR